MEKEKTKELTPKQVDEQFKNCDQIEIKIHSETKRVIGVKLPEGVDIFDGIEILNITAMDMFKRIKQKAQPKKKIIVPENKIVKPA